ncbi:amidohydrolase family protein [Candidatus Hodarchaeum mangrovi]
MNKTISLLPSFQMNRNGTIVDAHVHPIRSLATGESIIKEMKEAGVKKAVLLALDLDKNVLNDDIELKNQIIQDLWAYSLFIDPEKLINVMYQMLDIGTTPNSLIAKLVADFPEFFIGFGSVNPRKNEETVKNRLDEIKSLELKGIKLLPTLQFFKPGSTLEIIKNRHQRQVNANIKRIFSFAKKENIPVLIHPGKDPGPWEIHTLRCVQDSHPKIWRNILNRFKNNKFILAHLGCYGCDSYDDTWLNEAVNLAASLPNLYLDTSAVPYHLENKQIVKLIRKTCSFEKIIFGSDSPVVYRSSMLHSIKIIENSPLLTELEKDLILFGNALEFLELY